MLFKRNQPQHGGFHQCADATSLTNQRAEVTLPMLDQMLFSSLASGKHMLGDLPRRFLCVYSHDTKCSMYGFIPKKM